MAKYFLYLENLSQKTKHNNTNKINQVRQTLFPKFLEKIMLKLVQKHFKKLIKNDEPFYFENTQLKILNWG